MCDLKIGRFVADGFISNPGKFCQHGLRRSAHQSLQTLMTVCLSSAPWFYKSRYEKKIAVLLSSKEIKQNHRTLFVWESPFSVFQVANSVLKAHLNRTINHMYTRYWSSIFVWWTTRAMKVKAVFLRLFVNQLYCSISFLSNRKYWSIKKLNSVFFKVGPKSSGNTMFCFIIN